MIGFARMEKEKKMNDDVISRQAVLRCIKESRENIDWGQSKDGDAFLHYSAALYRTIASKECLPPIEPKRGKWKRHYEVLEKTSEYLNMNVLNVELFSIVNGIFVVIVEQ